MNVAVCRWKSVRQQAHDHSNIVCWEHLVLSWLVLGGQSMHDLVLKFHSVKSDIDKMKCFTYLLSVRLAKKCTRTENDSWITSERRLQNKVFRQKVSFLLWPISYVKSTCIAWVLSSFWPERLPVYSQEIPRCLQQIWHTGSWRIGLKLVPGSQEASLNESQIDWKQSQLQQWLQ